MMLKSQPICKDFFLILAAWLIMIGAMLVLQLMGLDFGFQIWPFGEFRNWIELLEDGPGWKAAKLFWVLDHRNGMSPWWYLAARPLIEATPAAPLILHLLAGLLVGVSSYLLLTELTHARAFGLSVGMLSALFIVNVYRDGVIWNLLGALGCTLLSIWLFALYCKNRRNSGYLGASYVLWFIALSTYTIQVGAIAGIFFVSLRNRLSGASWSKAVIESVVDVLPYAALLLLYIILWITTTAEGMPAAYRFHFSFYALAKSIAFGIWNEHYQYFWIWLLDAGPRLMAAVFVLFAMAILALSSALQAGECTRPTVLSIGFALVIGACVVAPTVVLEAMSDVWIPGTRWPMLMQFWVPMLFCVLAFAMMSTVRTGLWRPLWLTVNACAAAFVVVLVLGFNRTQVIHVRMERAFFYELGFAVKQDRDSGFKFPRRYLIQLADPAPFLPVGRLRDVYAHTLLGRDVKFEVVTNLPKPSAEITVLLWKDQRLSKVALTSPCSVSFGSESCP